MKTPSMNLKTEWTRNYWLRAKKISKAVDKWPEWKKLGIRRVINPDVEELIPNVPTYLLLSTN